MTARSKPVKAWMIQGPSGGLAPYYGWDFTRKALLQRLARDGVNLIPGRQTPVRVAVTVSLEHKE